MAGKMPVILGGLGLVLVLLGAGALIFPRPRPDIPLPGPLPQDGLRVTVFGTSLSSPPQHWPEALQAALSTCRAGPVTVTRVSRPGAGSDWALANLERVVTSRPDLIVLEFAINDADLRDGRWLGPSRRNHANMLTHLQHALPRAQILMTTMSPAHGPRGWTRARLHAHYAQYADLAQEFGTGFLDIHARWQALPRDKRGLDGDGLHPDPDIAAKVILPALLSVAGLCPQKES